MRKTVFVRRLYQVTWYTEVQATSHGEAAALALAQQRDPTSTPTFSVRVAHHTTVRIDTRKG